MTPAAHDLRLRANPSNEAGRQQNEAHTLTSAEGTPREKFATEPAGSTQEDREAAGDIHRFRVHLQANLRRPLLLEREVPSAQGPRRRH